jgi:hypothetical protein
MAEQQQSNIRQEYTAAQTGLNLDRSVSQVQKGQLTYALNAAVENFDANSVNYQNEPGNELCLNFPEGYHIIGTHSILEQNKHIFFLTNPTTGDSEIGYMDNNDCVYKSYISAKCLNFNINYPIHKVVHRITNCSTEIYWTDGLNSRRFLDLDNLPYKIQPGTDVCDNKTIPEVDCNKLNIQPDFSIPELEVTEVINIGGLTAGTYQFAIQYCDVAGDGYTSYYSVTNPTPIANENITTPNFDYPVGKSIVLNISNLDVTGYFKYYNVAVIKTVNAITSVELIGTYFIDDSTNTITYTGQNQTQIRLTVNDIFEKFPYYDIAQDVTAVQDLLVWDNLTSIDRINYQKIANQIDLKWQTYKLPASENYADELNATNLRGYLRDEVYAFEIVFLLKNGKQTDGFHIPGRVQTYTEQIQPPVPNTNPDFIGTGTSAPYWQVYNTASVIGPALGSNIGNAIPYEYGEFAYWESTEVYPCNDEVWGELANQPIRHHKFPDVRVSPIFESGAYTVTGPISPVMQERSIFPIGVRLDVQQVQQLISTSNLTSEQKQNIAGFKIVRGDRNTNSSIVGKGILRNVGKYDREDQTYYFPNYPYNDLREDPFLLEKNNAYNEECITWEIVATTDVQYEYTDCYTNELASGTILSGVTSRVCSISTPIIKSGTGVVNDLRFDTYVITSDGVYVEADYTNVNGTTSSVNVFFGQSKTIQVKEGTVPNVTFNIGGYTITQQSEGNNLECYPDRLKAFESDSSKYRFVFNSPETSFGSPFLGGILKLESGIFGAGKAHFVEVKKNALYKLLTKEAQQDALGSSENLANVTGSFNATAMFTAYQAYLTIYINGITRRNYAYSYNSIASYDYWAPIDNNLGIKQRNLDIAQYLIPGVQSVGDNHNINNFQRESSVYLKTSEDVVPLPFPSDTNSLLIGGSIPAIEDKSRYIVSSVKNNQNHCVTPSKEFDIETVCYYASLKDIVLNQWGQIYSYQTIDTGFQRMLSSQEDPTVTIFGGDTFINKFSFKTKLPFFIDNRVNGLDDSDVFYDELGNVAYPEYWHSARSILYDFPVTTGSSSLLKNVISIKAHNFDCPNNQLPAPDSQATPPIVNPGRTYYDGKFYLFAYGIPTFYCESSINVDLRQAFNNREGDFWPHVSTSIPDDWVQESYVTINQDNTYYYNPSFSKQNRENSFSHLPINWDNDQCFTYFPFRAIYSERQQSFTDNRVNSWLIYKPISFFDFPQNYGKLTSLDGIQNRAILARFENKSLLYNTLLTINTSNPQAAYIGNESLFRSSPPIDFAETDLGYVGSQNKMLLKIPQGQITIDAKRGQVFLISGNQATDLSGFGSGLNRFFTDHLAFEILRYFPNVPTDNHFNGIGLHGVYDSKFDRIIISKLDYIPTSNNVKYDSAKNEFYVDRRVNSATIRTVVDLDDQEYFCNKSWTLSFNFNTNSWVSFHSYIPNWYIAENNFFYSGINGGCDLEAIAAEETSCAERCELEGTAELRECSLEGTADFIDCTINGYAEEYILTTTTSTTTIPPICDLEGSAESITTTTTTTTILPVCNLEGSAELLTTTTTTTTTVAPICNLEGNAEIVYDCAFTGYAEEFIPVLP